jgi:hypothetical protein
MTDPCKYAFPRGAWDAKGMELRDYIATRAMVAHIQMCNQPEQVDPDQIATCSYGCADAMCSAREGPDD